jgi:FkbM family methyltransferase
MYYRGSNRSKTIIDDFDGSLRIQIDRAELIGSHIYWNGFYARDELAILSEYLRPGAVFVDAGANVGEFSLFAGKRVGPGRVVAIEPLSSAFQQLETNVRLNGFEGIVRVLNLALAESEREFTLFVAREVDDWRRWGSLNGGTASIFKATDRPVEGERVRGVPLDQVLATEGIEHVDVVKVDVEGAELSVLRGAAKTLERDRPVLLVEICEWNFQSAGYSRADLVTFLKAYDYRCSVVMPGHGLRTTSGVLPEFCNLLCVAC